MTEVLPFEEIVLLTGMPRSGTSWLSQVFDSSPDVRFRLSPLFSYAFKNAVNERSSRAEWDAVLVGAYHSDDAFMNQTERRKAGDYPTFPDKDPHPRLLVIKQTRFHNLLERLLELYPELKLVVIVRHPCGAIHSWLSAPREFPADADPMVEWRTGASRKTGFGEFWGFEDWKTVTRLHLRLARAVPDRVKIIRYADLVESPVEATRELFRFAGLPFTGQTEQFLAASQQQHEANPYAVFKHPSVKDRWRSELKPEIAAEIIEEIRGTELEEFLT